MLVLSTFPEETSVRKYQRSISDIYSCTSEARCNCIWPDLKWNASLCQLFTWHPELREKKEKKAASQSRAHRARLAALESDTQWSDGKIESCLLNCTGSASCAKSLDCVKRCICTWSTTKNISCVSNMRGNGVIIFYWFICPAPPTILSNMGLFLAACRVLLQSLLSAPITSHL